MSHARTKIYFASDFHLGSPNEEVSLVREKKVVAWLEAARADAAEIFLSATFSTFGSNTNEPCPEVIRAYLVKYRRLQTAAFLSMCSQVITTCGFLITSLKNAVCRCIALP